MIEAHQLEHRPWLYAIVRRVELVRWTLGGKVFHREARWYARLLALWLALTGYETERCLFCGWKVNHVWWCEDQILWGTVTGYMEGGGISCIDCFEKRASAMGFPLRWKVRPLCGYTNGEWLRIVEGNAKRGLSNE